MLPRLVRLNLTLPSPVENPFHVGGIQTLGADVENEADVASILGVIFMSTMFLGVILFQNAIPVGEAERIVFYREQVRHASDDTYTATRHPRMAGVLRDVARTSRGGSEISTTRTHCATARCPLPLLLAASFFP